MRFNKIFLSLLFVLGIGITTVNSQNTKDKEVIKLIKKKRAFNKKNGFGFRIQLFYGLETKARTELKSFNIEYPKIKTYIDYSNPPYWKSLVGDYRTKLEADKALNGFKKKFPGAIVVPR